MRETASEHVKTVQNPILGGFRAVFTYIHSRFCHRKIAQNAAQVIRQVGYVDKNALFCIYVFVYYFQKIA